MKKLMIAAAIVCAAAYANAAAVNFNWLASAAGDNQLPVYICQAGATGFESLADIQTYLIGTSGNFGTMAYDDWEDSSATLGSVAGVEGTEGTMQDFTYVIVNSDGSGYWTAAGQAELYTTSSTHVDSSIDVTSLLATSATPWSSGPTPTPEPTSGLLLLLGVAGLALRRRRA